MWHFWSAFMYIRSRSKQTKTSFFFFLTEPLIYDEMGDMSASISKRHAYRSQSHTLDYGKKANHNLPKKRACVVCPVSKI